VVTNIVVLDLEVAKRRSGKGSMNAKPNESMLHLGVNRGKPNIIEKNEPRINGSLESSKAAER
jgi:hypothetical protein